MKKVVSRFVSSLLVIVILSGAALAFRFVSTPITSQSTVDPPSGSLSLTGSWPAHFIVNQSSVGIFYVKNAINAAVTFSLNMSISGVSDLYTVDPTIAGEVPNIVLVAPVLYATSAHSYTLQPGEQMEIDCGGTFHKTGSYTLSLKAIGDAG